MGQHQVYRGNPVQKQYYITNNFNGGINTLDVDELLRDSEFRDLVNVDLGLEGMLQSRRGFSNQEYFNNLLDYYNRDLDDDNISYIKILENENNLLDRISSNLYDGKTFKTGLYLGDDFEGIEDNKYDINIADFSTDDFEIGDYVRVNNPGAGFVFIYNWSDSNSYSTYDLVKVSIGGGSYKFYLAIQNVPISTNILDTAYWLEVTSYFTNFLTSKIQKTRIHTEETTFEASEGDYVFVRNNVEGNNTYYVALQDSVGIPVNNTDYWQEVSDFKETLVPYHDNYGNYKVGDFVYLEENYTIYFCKRDTTYLEGAYPSTSGDTTTWEKLNLAYFYRIVPYYNYDLKILIIENNLIKLLKYTKNTNNATADLTYTTITNSAKSLPSVSTYKQNLIMNKSVEHVDKIYISLNDISEEYKGILVYDRDDDSWEVWRGEYLNSGSWTDMDSDILQDVYKPTPYEIQSTSSGLTQGFNVLAEDPLLYIDDQKTGLVTLRSIILTDTSTGAYLDKIPTDGVFTLNVIKTGSFAPENLQIKFRDQNNDYIGFNIGDYDSTEGYFLSYGTDNGGYISYKINLNDLSSISYVLIDVFWQDKIITKDYNGFNYLHPYDQYYAVEDEYCIYKQNDNSGASNDDAGTKLSDYLKITVDFRIIVSDVNLQEPSDAGIFDSYMTSTYDNKIFQFISATQHRTFIYEDGTPGLFTELNSDNILYTTWEHFIPLSGTLVDYTLNSPNYYMYLDLPNLSDLSWAVTKTDIDLSLEVPSLEGIYYEIGDDDPEEPIEGIDLEDIKLVEIDDKMAYFKGNTIYFSKLYQFDYIPNFSFLILPLLSTDEIVKIKYFKGSWIIFTKNTIWKMKGTYGDSDWQVQKLNDSIGCSAPETVVSIENTLYFLAVNGLYRLAQNYYQEGLENVYKMDKKIPNIIPKDDEVKALLYRDQYIMYLPQGYDYDTVRMYYNIDLVDKLKPFVKDKFTNRPTNLFEYNGNLYSINGGKLYLYDEGYMDFNPYTDTNAYDDDYTFSVIVKTSNINFGTPTHDKKIKSIYIKTKSDDPTYLYFTVWLDGYLRAEPTSFRAVLDDNEEIVYEEYIDYTKDSNINLQLAQLGNFEIGDDVLGDNENSTHKLTLGYKGKTIQLQIEQQSNGNFGITNIGYLYKLGKVKEQR